MLFPVMYFHPMCASYPLLVEQLSKRFTPVQIQSVQSSLFHDRKQRPGEAVDTFAQELRPLYMMAYPPAQRGSEEAETMGRAVLANQFLAGLHRELKGKLAGQEGTFDQLLARARFEEAKLRNFCGDSGWRSCARSYGGESDRQSTGIISQLPGSRTVGGSVPDEYVHQLEEQGMALHRQVQVGEQVRCRATPVEPWCMCGGTALTIL